MIFLLKFGLSLREVIMKLKTRIMIWASSKDTVMKSLDEDKTI